MDRVSRYARSIGQAQELDSVDCDGHAQACARMRPEDALSSADPGGVSAQIDLIGVPLLNIGFEPSAAPNERGGDGRVHLLGRWSHLVSTRGRGVLACPTSCAEPIDGSATFTTRMSLAARNALSGVGALSLGLLCAILAAGRPPGTAPGDAGHRSRLSTRGFQEVTRVPRTTGHRFGRVPVLPCLTLIILLSSRAPQGGVNLVRFSPLAGDVRSPRSASARCG